MRSRAVSLCGTALLLGAVAAQAQSPEVSASLSPGPVVTVGQPLTVEVTVLVPSFFAGAPEFERIDVPSAVTLFNDQGRNVSERRDGSTWAGQVRSYTVYPQRAGTWEIPSISVEVRYRGEGGIVTRTGRTAPMTFEARIPAGAEGLDYFIAARALSLTENFDLRPDTLAVGETFTRTLNATVDGALSMVIPPLEVDSIQGLAIYAGQPRVEDSDGERGEAIRGTRTESLTYVAEAPGDYVVPGVALTWWDSDAGVLRESSLEEVRFTVVQGEAESAAFGIPPDSLDSPVEAADADEAVSLRDILRTWLLPLASAGLLLWLGLLAWKRVVPRLRARRELLAAEREASEGTHWNALERAAASDDPAATMNALLAWLAAREGAPTPATCAALVAEAGDPAVETEVRALEARLYGPPGGSESTWRGAGLIDALGRVRRHHSDHGARGRDRAHHLGALNPRGAEASLHTPT